MSLQTPAGLEMSVENLRGIVADLVGQMERMRNEMAALKAAYGGHSHTITATTAASTTGTAPAGGGAITATTTATTAATASPPV